MALIRIKEACLINRSTLNEKTNPDYKFKYIDIGSIEEGRYTSKLITFSESPSRARKQVKKGDVIVSTVRTYLRAIASIKYDECPQVVSTGFCVITPKKIHADFLKYACNSEGFISQIMLHAKGISYPAVSDSVVANAKIEFFSEKKQKEIGDFLDNRVEQINKLVAFYKKEITLLEEYKTSLIHNAVTKGLDANGCRILDGTPAAEMEWKDSGVDWIGEIPSDIEIVNGKHFMSSKKEKNK